MVRVGRTIDEIGTNICRESRGEDDTLGMALSAGRVPNRDKLLPSPQVLKQQQMEMIIEAQKALDMQNAVQGAVAEKERVDQRFKDVREGLARRALVEKVVEQAAGKNEMNGENGNAPTNQ